MTATDRSSRRTPVSAHRLRRPVVEVPPVPERPAGGTTWQSLERLGGTVTGVHGRDWRPRYLQLAEELRVKITSGELAPAR